MTTYNYQLTDFPNEKADAEKLQLEVQNSSIDNEVTGVTTHINSVKIDFIGSLDSTEVITLNTIVATHDGEPLPTPPIQVFIESNAEVTVTPSDSTTSYTADFVTMQTLVNRRELFNDTENPIYDSNVTPILGNNGYLVEHANRINNLEIIHGKIGWHSQQITKAAYERPDNLLIYYGWMNSFNYGVNGWSNEAVAQDMAKYKLIVLGDGIQDSGHGDYANTSVIIPRIQALNPNTKIFGYVTVNQSLENFETKVDQWETLGVNGIFMDEAGYDYGTTTTNSREAFNTKVDYVHGQTSASLCFVNAWNMDHIIGTANDATYPNTTWNPNLVASNLTYNDYSLIESFGVNTLSYSGNYETAASLVARGTKATGHRYTYGINLVSSCVIEDGHSDATALIDFAYIASMMYSLEAFGSSDHYYGASSAINTYLERPDVSGVGEVYELSPTIQVDAGDADVYHRYVQFGKFSLDFSSGVEISSIIKY